jgi:hypothetical protein
MFYGSTICFRKTWRETAKLLGGKDGGGLTTHADSPRGAA